MLITRTNIPAQLTSLNWFSEVNHYFGLSEGTLKKENLIYYSELCRESLASLVQSASSLPVLKHRNRASLTLGGGASSIGLLGEALRAPPCKRRACGRLWRGVVFKVLHPARGGVKTHS